VTRILALLLALALPTAAHAADVPNVLADADRIQDSRPVQVIVTPEQIGTTVDVGRVSSSAMSEGGGLLGAIIISSMDNKRQVLTRTAQSQAESTIEPLREALRGFDVNTIAQATTKQALAKPAWFQPSFVSAGTTVPSGSAQSAMVIYRYETSPDFTQIRVIADIRLNRTASSQAALLYRQTISSIVVLRAPSFEPKENVARWSADNGRLAKAALTSDFARLEQLIPFALELKGTDVKAITAKNRPKVFGAGYYGPAIERTGTTSGETLLWKDGLVSVMQSVD
jgi:hypothetical protein